MAHGAEGHGEMTMALRRLSTGCKRLAGSVDASMHSLAPPRRYAKRRTGKQDQHTFTTGLISGANAD